MNFVDATIVRLADEATRTPLFDDSSLEQICGAAYDTGRFDVQGPFKPVFDEVTMGYAADGSVAVEGRWNPSGGMNSFDARLRLTGVTQALPRIDALWRGAIVARTSSANAPITDVSSSFPRVASVDESIVTDLGALPADPAVLEQERKDRLLALFRADMDQPQALTTEALDSWLEEVGASSAGHFLTEIAPATHRGAVAVTFAPPGPVSATPRSLPVVAAVLVRDAGFSTATLLQESKVVREQLEASGIERARTADAPVRWPITVIWAVPLSTFDDDDWPGAAAAMTPAQKRVARRAAAGLWLAREGIGLLAVDSP